MVNDPNPSSAESSSWLIRSVTRDEVEDSSAEEIRFFFITKQRTKTTPRGKKQAGTQKTGAQSNIKHSQCKTHERQRKTTDQPRTADTRRLYRETNEGNEGDTAGATETMIK